MSGSVLPPESCRGREIETIKDEGSCSSRWRSRPDTRFGGNLLLEYQIDNGAAVDLLEAKHPTARNIHKNRSEGRYVVIDTLDDEAFQIFSEMSDDTAYWELECQYRKVP